MFGGFATHPLQVFGHEGLVSLFGLFFGAFPVWVSVVFSEPGKIVRDRPRVPLPMGPACLI